tara:strand:+ start:442 stop:663 length:222 start_codon:yes stop_codon:yes gene_type:complete
LIFPLAIAEIFEDTKCRVVYCLQKFANSLAQLMANRQERQKAHDLLFPIYNGFTEGFSTTDLKEAQMLLQQLQ